MNPKHLELIRHDLTNEVLALGKDAPIDLETVLDSRFDTGAKFAEEAAAILAYDGETSSEYAERVQNWLRGLIEGEISDEDCEAYAERLAADAEVERKVDERIDAICAGWHREAA